MTIGKHTLALVSIIGSSLDVLGALYLAYDLLGEEHGPLRGSQPKCFKPSKPGTKVAGRHWDA